MSESGSILFESYRVICGFTIVQSVGVGGGGGGELKMLF